MSMKGLQHPLEHKKINQYTFKCRAKILWHRQLEPMKIKCMTREKRFMLCLYTSLTS